MLTRRALLGGLMAGVVGCQADGNLNLFGYSTAPPFDPTIKTVRVPVFKNVALQTTPNRELEVDITRAVVKEINARTSMRAVSDAESADTELLGTLVKIDKDVQNRTQQNHVREAYQVVTVQLLWLDLRDGRVLTNPRSPRPNNEPPPDAFDPSAPPPAPFRVKEAQVPISVTATGRYIPELGETTATGNQKAVEHLARQIVNMMEAGW